jgi:FMN phosphatase YigB (HAD superfamily)
MNWNGVFTTIGVVVVFYVIGKWLQKRRRKTPELCPYLPYGPPSPEKYIIAFDLHDVIMHPKSWEMLRLVVANKEGWGFLWNILIHPRVGVDFLFLLFSCHPWGLVTEQVFVHLSEATPALSSYNSWFISLANCFEPDPYTIDTLMALKNSKYHLVLFSNIGSQLFEDMRKTHPTIFDLFEEVVTTEQKSGYLRKPNPKAYSKFWSLVNPKEDKCVVFVDDSLKNLTAAGKHHPNFYGFHFLNGKDLYHSFLRWNFFNNNNQEKLKEQREGFGMK